MEGFRFPINNEDGLGYIVDANVNSAEQMLLHENDSLLRTMESKGDNSHDSHDIHDLLSDIKELSDNFCCNVVREAPYANGPLQSAAAAQSSSEINNDVWNMESSNNENGSPTYINQDMSIAKAINSDDSGLGSGYFNMDHSSGALVAQSKDGGNFPSSAHGSFFEGEYASIINNQWYQCLDQQPTPYMDGVSSAIPLSLSETTMHSQEYSDNFLSPIESISRVTNISEMPMDTQKLVQRPLSPSQQGLMLNSRFASGKNEHLIASQSGSLLPAVSGESTNTTLPMKNCSFLMEENNITLPRNTSLLCSVDNNLNILHEGQFGAKSERNSSVGVPRKFAISPDDDNVNNRSNASNRLSNLSVQRNLFQNTMISENNKAIPKSTIATNDRKVRKKLSIVTKSEAPKTTLFEEAKNLLNSGTLNMPLKSQHKVQRQLSSVLAQNHQQMPSSIGILKSPMNFTMFPQKHAIQPPEIIVMQPIRTRKLLAARRPVSSLSSPTEASSNPLNIISELYDNAPIDIPIIKERQRSYAGHTIEDRRKQKHKIIPGAENLIFEIHRSEDGVLEDIPHDAYKKSSDHLKTKGLDDLYPEAELPELDEIFGRKRKTSCLLPAASKRVCAQPTLASGTNQPGPPVEIKQCQYNAVLPATNVHESSASFEEKVSISIAMRKRSDISVEKSDLTFTSESDTADSEDEDKSNVSIVMCKSLKCSKCRKLFKTKRSLSIHTKRCTAISSQLSSPTKVCADAGFSGINNNTNNTKKSTDCNFGGHKDSIGTESEILKIIPKLRGIEEDRVCDSVTNDLKTPSTTGGNKNTKWSGIKTRPVTRSQTRGSSRSESTVANVKRMK